MTKWRTKLHLYGKTSNVENSFIDYLRRISQGNLLSLILLVLSVNPLSYLLSKEQGYTINVTPKAKEISPLFFVDDLKLHASSLNKIMKLLDIVTQVTNDVGMTFGESKCAYQWIEKGLMTREGEPIRIGGLTIKEIENEDSYRYLGIHESVGALGPLNKEKVNKEV